MVDIHILGESGRMRIESGLEPVAHDCTRTSLIALTTSLFNN